MDDKTFTASRLILAMRQLTVIELVEKILGIMGEEILSQDTE